MTATVGVLLATALLAALLLSRRWVRRVTVLEHERAVLYRAGRITDVLTPGVHWLLGFGVELTLVDVRARVFVVPGQEVLTSDGVGLKISLVGETAIVDPRAWVNASQSVDQSLYAEAQVRLREVVGAVTAEQLLTAREELSERILASAREAATRLGVELRSLAIKDLMFPGALRELFARVASAKQEGLAALERARGESAALRSLANAARLLDGNPNLRDLRVLQALADAKAGSVILNLGTAATTTILPSVPAGESR